MQQPHRKTLVAYAIKLLCLMMILPLCSSLQAQSFYGSIVGTVTDATGAVVPNAKVTVTNVGTSEATTITSDGAGKFSFVNLIPATYKVDISKASFKHFIHDQVTVEVGNTVRVDSALQVGAANETVEVSTEAPLLKTDSSTLSTEISAQQVQEMPLNGRNVLNLIALTPGVVPTGGAMGGTGLDQGTRTAGGAGFGNYQIGGSIQGQSAQFIDGVANNLLGGNIVALVPTQDAIQEFSVASSNAGADFGRFAGGVVNMATKSGGNKFHGSAWEYLRNRDFNANDYFSNFNPVLNPRVKYNQNQYGASINGPIMRDKLFFMFTWEGYKLNAANVTPTEVPTPALQAGVFANKITDPAGICNIQPYTGGLTGSDGNPIAAGGYYIQNLGKAGLIAGTTCGDPTGLQLKNIFPNPNANLTGTNWFKATPIGNNQNQYNGRVDYALSSNDRLFARYTYWTLLDVPHTEFNDQGQPGTSLTGYSGGWPTADGQTGIYTNQAVVGETHTFNPSTVLDVRANYVRVYSPNAAQDMNVNYNQFGTALAALAPQMNVHTMPGVQLNGPYGIYNANNYPNNGVNWNNTYGLGGNLVKIVRSHSLKFGAEMRLMDASSVNHNGAGGGSFQYNNSYSGDEWANFLMGYPSQVQFKTAIETAEYSYYSGYYVTDTWQASKNLTLTLGLRYELPGVTEERNNKATVLLPNAVDPISGVKGTEALVASSLYGNRGDVNPYHSAFGPRLGLAYRATSTTVVRGGYGIAYLPNDISGGTNPNGAFVNGATTSPNIPGNYTSLAANQLQQILAPIPAGGTTSAPLAFNPSNGRGNATVGTGPTYFMSNLVSATSYKGQTIQGPVPTQPYPWVQQWNMSLSHEFKNGLVADVAYTGLHGTNMPGSGGRELNEINASTYNSSGLALTGPQTGSLLSAAATSCPNAPTFTTMAGLTVGQCLRPNPYYKSIQDTAEYFAVENYRSFQAKAEKRMGAMGVLMANYTWAQNKGNTDTQTNYLEQKATAQGGSGAGGYQDYNNLKGEYSLISYDVTNRVIVAYNLNLPFGKGKKFGNNFAGPIDTLVSGWAINGVTTFQSGFPVFLAMSSNNALKNANLGIGTLRPQIVPGCQAKINESGLARVQAGAWFNTSCFTAPGAWSFGNEPRVDPVLRGDGQKNFDFSFQKSTSIAEGFKLEFRTEFFNVFNRVQFAPPIPSVGAGNFGAVTYQVNHPRQLQLSLRLNY